MSIYAGRSTDARTGKMRFRHVPGYGWYRAAGADVILNTKDEVERDHLAKVYLKDNHIDHRYCHYAIQLWLHKAAQDIRNVYRGE